MKLSSFSRFALRGCVAAILAGCGGSQPSIDLPGATTRQSSDGGRSMRLLYVAENTLGRVDVYDARKPAAEPIAEITDGVDTPVGLCIGSDGILYVLNNTADSISEYEPGRTEPFQTIAKGLDFPEFCALDSRGNLWVSNLGGNNVTEYKRGSTTPSAMITSGVSLPTGIAFDRGGDLYVAGSNAEEAYVAEYAKGANSPNRTITDGVVDPDGITVDAKGTLYVTNLSTPSSSDGDVEEYKAGQSTPYQAIMDMRAPGDVVVDQAGYTYVSEGFAPAVAVFRSGSTQLWHQFRQGMNTPLGIAYYVGAPPR